MPWALGTEIAEVILAFETDYPLARKDNQRSLAEETALYFDSPEASALPVFETTDADHGRIVTRRHRVSHDAGWLNGSRSAPAEPHFPGLRAIACVDAVTERSGQTTRARRFFQPSLPLSSLPLNETLLARAVRAHRGIENRLLWVMDVVFHDDLMRQRNDNGPQNMATIKHTAMNLLRSASGKDSLKVRRKTAGWHHKYLKALITKTAL